ncbi:MAG: Crp/Fnr family transcriptional regulator [Sphingobacteriales bacterium]|jgi:CRP/FNR family transcriptional regulator|nr:Crp/Fnr family transcriptional regulator [Sphingobacteriales bacterium]
MQQVIDEIVLSYLNKQFPYFNDELKNLIASVSSIRYISKGETLIQAGQYLKHTALIVEGRIKLYRESEYGDEAFMYYLESGNACALSMLCASRQKTSEITAKAIEDSTAIMIPIQYTDELMKYHPDWYNFAIETYRSRFEEMLEVFDNVVFKAMDERLEAYLKNQFKSLQSNRLELTHQEIANDLNTSREVISRLLKKLEQKGDIALNRKYIEKIK